MVIKRRHLVHEYKLVKKVMPGRFKFDTFFQDSLLFSDSNQRVFKAFKNGHRFHVLSQKQPQVMVEISNVRFFFWPWLLGFGPRVWDLGLGAEIWP